MTARFLGIAVVAASSMAVVGHAQTPPPYRVVMADATHTLAVQGADLVTLDAAARLFGLTVRDDARAGGAVIAAGSLRIVITAGQPTVSAGGRVVSLSAPVVRSGSTWLVPVDLFRALNRGIDVRRASRLIVVPPAVVPRLTPRFERTATGGRLTIGVEPAATSRITRDGSALTIRLQAHALDLEPLAGAPPELLTGLRVADATLVVDLGSGVTNVRSDEARDPSRIVIDLVGTPAATPLPTAQPLPPVSMDKPSGIQTVVLDPGHGGDDNGARTPAGTFEKDIALAVAVRVKALLEARMGVRVVMTRDGDAAVPLDRRAALANNHKADLFISLHANGSPIAAIRGAQVSSLDPADYAAVEGATPRTDAPALPVPLVGGGSRVIDTVPWHLAQLPHADASSRLATIVARRLGEQGVTMQPRSVDRGPMRTLVGANMPAVLIELGMLTNDDDARALGDSSHVTRLAEAIVAAVADVRYGIPQ